jgi:hypothetical protein
LNASTAPKGETRMLFMPPAKSTPPGTRDGICDSTIAARPVVASAWLMTDV